MDPHLEQLAREHAESEHWRAQLRRLRALARGEQRGGYRNSTGRLDRRSWSELAALAAAGRRAPEERKGAHRKGRLTAGDEGSRHVRDYLAGCRKYARSLGDEGLAARVHELVGAGEGYLVNLSGHAADRPWPSGHQASAISAHIHRRAGFGAGTAANRMAAVRHRPRPDADRFVLDVRPRSLAGGPERKVGRRD